MYRYNTPCNTPSYINQSSSSLHHMTHFSLCSHTPTAHCVLLVCCYTTLHTSHTQLTLCEPCQELLAHIHVMQHRHTDMHSDKGIDLNMTFFCDTTTTESFCLSTGYLSLYVYLPLCVYCVYLIFLSLVGQPNDVMMYVFVSISGRYLRLSYNFPLQSSSSPNTFPSLRYRGPWNAYMIPFNQYTSTSDHFTDAALCLLD